MRKRYLQKSSEKLFFGWKGGDIYRRDIFQRDIFVGDIFVGDIFVGDIFVGDIFVGDIFVGDIFVRDIFVRDFTGGAIRHSSFVIQIWEEDQNQKITFTSFVISHSSFRN